jgi:hypothetical protein
MIDPSSWYPDCRIDGGNDEEGTLAGRKESYMKIVPNPRELPGL